MKVLTIWRVRPGALATATERFLRTGANPPQGAHTIGRWHFADGSGGVHVYECDDLGLVRQFSQLWGDVLELETRPVLDDAEAAAAVMAAISA
jgi:hypothetical protein